MENFEEYQTTGLVKQERNTPNCVANRFDCQTSPKQTTASEVTQTQLVVGTPFSLASVPQTSQIPIIVSFKTEDSLSEDGDTCVKTEVIDTESATVFCICCLEENVSYVRLLTCEHAEFLNSMVMPEIKPKNQVICYQCHHMLKKIKLFKQQVEESFKLLSDGLENIPKRPNQIHNFKIRQNFNINIPQTVKNMEPVRVNTEVPKVPIKPNKNKDDNIKKEVIEAIDTREKRPKPKSPDRKTKQSKNIEEALRIINSNQNNDCINILTNSLKNISSTLLSDLLINFDLGSQIDKTITPETIEENNMTATLKEKNIDAQEKIAFKSDATKLAITTENLAKFLVKKASKADTTNIAKNLAQGNLTTKIAKALMDDSIKISTDSVYVLPSTVISKDNLMKNAEENSLSDPTNNTSKKKLLTPEDIGKGLLLPKVKPKLVKETTKKPVQVEAVSKTEEIIGRIITEHYSMVENDSGGDSNQPVTEKETVGVEKEGVGGGDDVQAVESTIDLYTQPCLGLNIIQLNLSRRQIMDERAKIATTQAYLGAPHRCASCLIGFQYQENLEDHVKRKHTKGKKNCVECNICHQLVDNGSSFAMHTFWHHTRFQCVACEQLFASYDRAAFHYRKQHMNRKHQNVKQAVVFRCPRCTYKTTQQRLLKHHITGCRPASTDVTLDTSLTNSTEAPTEAKRAKITPSA